MEITNKDIYKKLVLIEELLEKIEENTRPVVSVPTIWTWPPCDTDSNNYEPDVQITWQCHNNTGCNCKVCNPRSIKGCIQCGCNNIAIYDEHGQWWCNNCWRVKSEG